MGTSGAINLLECAVCLGDADLVRAVHAAAPADLPDLLGKLGTPPAGCMLQGGQLERAIIRCWPALCEISREAVLECVRNCPGVLTATLGPCRKIPLQRAMVHRATQQALPPGAT